MPIIGVLKFAIKKFLTIILLQHSLNQVWEYVNHWAPFVVALLFITAISFGKSSLRFEVLPRFRFRPIKPFYQQVLDAYFTYYQHLDSPNKKRFERRVQAFIDNKQFIPRSIPAVTDEMKALIAGSAIQLTFGFRHLNFVNFKRILVYPDDYYSRITRKYHRGEVNPRGLIVISWKAFEEGYRDDKDGRNLALHEMAHALRLENAIYNEEFDFIPEKQLQYFDRLAMQQVGKMKMGEVGIFRNYGSGNVHEFFAVAVEVFFEQPHEFLKEKPELYRALSALLNQDPVRLFHL
jgi:Mlc titration factor MtfA (ptsG expression regulator)